MAVEVRVEMRLAENSSLLDPPHTRRRKIPTGSLTLHAFFVRTVPPGCAIHAEIHARRHAWAHAPVGARMPKATCCRRCMHAWAHAAVGARMHGHMLP
eukprot:356004-Chlamydomonas_euryale.AAC.3